ncbi:MAG: hypothetical protein WCT53_06115 [Candidatus Gracilibacteria bacterium]|jgi:hypothetical protein
MKKTSIALAVVATILLTGCFGNTNSATPANTQITGFKPYETSDFTIQIPEEWEVLTAANFRQDTPPNTVVAFRSNLRNPVFTANLIILKNDLSGEIPSIDYAKALQQKTATELNGYRELTVSDYKLIVSKAETATLYESVEGRNMDSADLKVFEFISAVKGKTAYIVMGSMLTNEQEAVAKKIETAIKSFEVK